MRRWSQQPVRDFKFRSAFSLSFADLSPIVGIYTVFAIGLIAAGPAFLWAFPLVLVGQLMVCGVFGNLVSKWPLQGSVYAWSRELIGPRYGWFTGWAYMWGLTLTLAVLPITAAPYILGAAGVTAPSQIVVELVAIGVLLFGSIANVFGGRLLKGLIYIALVCELVASAGIGLTLLIFHRINPLSIIFNTGGTGHGAGWLFGAFLLPVAYIAYSFIGFEASASIGEEVQESRKVLPKAVVLSLAVGGVLVIVACLGLVLAMPDVSAAVSGKDTNPIATTLEHAYGSGAGRTLLIALAIGFTSSMIAVQTAVTRAIWASARDQLLPGTRLLGRLSGREHLPRYAIGLTVIIAGALIFAGASKVFALLVSFSAFGFILSYYMPIVALSYKQWRGRSPTADGWGARWIPLITSIAVVWLSAEIVNLLWPRAVNSEWYLNWGAIIMTGVLGVLGGLICLRSFRPGVARDAGPAHGRRGGRGVGGRGGRGMTQVALISGAASGIGRACAEVMRGAGWRTAGIDLNASDTDLSLRADVSDRAAVAAAVDQVVAAVRADRPAGHRGRLLRGRDRRRRHHRRAVGPDARGDTGRHGELLRRGAAAHAEPGPGSHRGHLVGAGAGRQRDRPALRGGQGRGARLDQVAGHGGRADRHPGERGGAGTDRHAAAGPGLPVARARVPGHVAAGPAGPAPRRSPRPCTTWPPRGPCTAVRCSRRTPGR